MRRTQLLLAAIVLVVTAGCGGAAGQPKIYRVAIDNAPLFNITAAACFRNSIVPTSLSSVTDTNFREPHQWVIWDGVEGKQYLDIGNRTFKLGQTPTIVVSDEIEGADRAFAGSRLVRTDPGGGPTELRNTQILINFSDLGNSPTGTIALKANYQCTAGANPCPSGAFSPADSAPECAATLNFVGRLISTSQFSVYTPDGK